jgi:hypothetical protein
VKQLLKNVWILVGICTNRISLHVLLDATKIEWKVVVAAAAAAAAAESLIYWAKDMIPGLCDPTNSTCY